MAEDQDERTEKPSGRKLSEARAEGQVSVSRDAPQWMGMAMGTVALFTLGGSFQESLVGLLRGATMMMVDPAPERLWPLLSAPFELGLLICTLATVAVIAGYLVQTGGHVWPNLIFKGFSGLLSLQGLTRMFSRRMLVDLGLSLVKTGAVVWVFWTAVSADFLSLPAISLAPPGEQFQLMWRPIAHGAVKVLAAMLVLVGIDIAISRYRHLKGLKMTKQELKREAKDDEGDPQVRGRRKAKHRELARGRAAVEVPRADALVVNPTHIAVAIRYRPGKDPAPLVTAKGKGEIAEYMRELARQHGIPIYEDIPLARLLHRKVKVGRAVPAETYKAVAAVLAFVYRVTRRKAPVVGAQVQL
ncbi:MAG: EscU/YscU/HrcU family type III secretion system export apparatus switch protein [Myxococcales bacterium]|nr:EscU/YscU/HrcU family type III secretion system export apparatus switch protein [Myxococcales bacterium]